MNPPPTPGSIQTETVAAFGRHKRRVTIVARNATARHLQLIWQGDRGGLVGPGEEFWFEFPLKSGPITLEMTTPVSPDSTMLRPGDGGQLYTADSVWTFGKYLPGDGLIATVRLNGAQPNKYVWSGSAMCVDHGGSLYLQNGDEWWVWTPRRFTRCKAP